jgi:hypothetical protein
VLVGSLFWNARFFLGYGEMRQAMRAFAARDSGQAARLMSAASRHVPERPELGVFAALFEGVDLLQRDKAAEALPVLVKCRGKLPPHWRVEDLLLRAEIAAAFDAKNYDRFLELALQMQQGAPNDPQAAAPAASAYACKYAVTGKEEFRQQALRLLDKAKAAGDSKELREYEDRILHRLETREILSRREFQQKFPNGWGPSRKKPT